MTDKNNIIADYYFAQSEQMVLGLKKAQANLSQSVDNIQLMQTHSAWVLLTGEFAYKIKKPVNFGFLDFSTLDKRETFCRREWQLNQRYAPEIYLGVVEIYGDYAHPILGDFVEQDNQADIKDLSVIDYAVKMKQFPLHQLLSDLAKKDLVSVEMLDQLCVMIADLHLSAKVALEDSAFGSAAQVEYWMLENFDVIRPQLSSDSEEISLSQLEQKIITMNEGLSSVFFRRKQQGFIRECHGDMHLGNLTLIDGRVVAFDCIEFNDELRWIDVMSEIAFLTMDLSMYQLSAFSYRLINRYLQRTGDYEGLKILGYYQVYRALVRAKVAILRRQQLDPAIPEYSQETETYHRYLDFANNCLQPKPRFLMITHGLSGSGKSTLAEKIVEETGAIQIRSDVERKRLSSMKADEKSESEVNTGLYAGEQTNRTYQHLHELAGTVLSAGYSAILDATYLDKKFRQQALKIAEDNGVKFIILSCFVEQKTMEARIVKREAKATDASEATLEVLAYQQSSADVLDELERQYTIEVDTGKVDCVSQLRQNPLISSYFTR